MLSDEQHAALSTDLFSLYICFCESFAFLPPLTLLTENMSDWFCPAELVGLLLFRLTACDEPFPDVTVFLRDCF